MKNILITLLTLFTLQLTGFEPVYQTDISIDPTDDPDNEFVATFVIHRKDSEDSEFELLSKPQIVFGRGEPSKFEIADKDGFFMSIKCFMRPITNLNNDFEIAQFQLIIKDYNNSFFRQETYIKLPAIDTVNR